MSSESDNPSDDPDPGIFKRTRTKRSTSSRRSNKEYKSSRTLKEDPPCSKQNKRRKHDQKKEHSKSSYTSRTSIMRDSSSTDDDLSSSANIGKRVTHSTPTPRVVRELSTESLSSSRAEITKEDAEILHREAELVRSVCKKKCDSVVEDATDLIQNLVEAYNNVTKSFNKPNVLVTGITGAGKSTLINSMFGQEVAATGSGVPITRHFTKYDSPDMRTVIYDSKGLEHGYYEEFIETTNAFFDDHQSTPSDAIHVVWYIVNAAHARFEPFEQELCKKLFWRAPIFFLLNKADISSQDDRDNLRKVIEDMHLPNCCGILDIIADSSTKLKSCDTCPKCHSDDIVEKRKSAVMVCSECGHIEPLVMDHGLDVVVKSTLVVLPSIVRENFVAAQSVSFGLKEETSHKVIGEFWEDFTVSRSCKDLLHTITRMIARLSLVWEFTGHSDEIGTLLASDLVTCMKWKKTNSHLWKKKKVIPSESQRLHVTSLGILWNLCLRELAQQLVQTWASDLRTSKKCTTNWNDTCSVLFHKVFSAMNEENLHLVESELMTCSNFSDVLHQTHLKISVS